MEYDEQEPEQYECPDCNSYYEAIEHYNRELKELRDQAPNTNRQRMAELEGYIKGLQECLNNHEHMRRYA